MILGETIQAALSGITVRAAILARFDFASGTDRVWSGFEERTFGGYPWKGMGRFGSVDGLSTRSDLAAEKITFKLSGVWPELVTIAKQQSTEVKGRPCYVYLQFFGEDWQTLDSPIAIRSGIMDQMTYEATGPDTRTITLTAESIFAARNSAPFAFYTDRDQNARFPGDRGLELIAGFVNKNVAWPRF